MNPNHLLELLDTPAPAVSAAEAVQIAQTQFGIKATAKPLVSDKDCNFLLETSDGPVAVIKISNTAEDPAVLDLQNRALLHIESTDPSLPVPRLRYTRDGQMHYLLDAANGESHVVRVLSWLEGDILDRQQVAAGLSTAIGTMLARLARSLRGFFHPAAGHQIIWDIKNALQLKKLLEKVSDPQLKALTGRVLDRFESRVQPRMGSLRAQIVHNDLNQGNVLVGKHDPAKPAGIIDFGDMVHTALINDLAVATAYQVNPGDDPLANALPLIRGYHAVTPLEEEEIGLLPELVMARLAASILIANWRVLKHPENRDYILIDNEASRLRLAAMDAVPRERMQLQLRQACKLAPTVVAAVPADTETLKTRRDKVLGPAYRLFYKDPLHFVRGEGVWLYDAEGRAYLDVYNNVPHVGHCHPHVTGAIARQAATLNTHTRYLHDTVITYSERLLSTFPDALSVVNFACSGSEANELALRIARAHSGAQGIIVTRHAYHGTTQATASISTEDWPVEALPRHVVTIPAPDPCRGPYRDPDEDLAARYLEHVTSAIETLHERGLKPAALIVDTLLSSEGIPNVPPGYLAQAAALVKQAGGLFIADEVQPGFGRTGDHFWGFQAHDVVPDLVTLGKPMGNGHPVSAVVMRAELAARFAASAHYFNTFGGNPVSAAAAMAVMDVIEQEELQVNALQTGAYLRSGLEQLAVRHQLIGEIRGSGLFLGLDLQTDRDKRTPATRAAAWIHNNLRENGILVGTTGPFANVLKLRPPMVFTRAHADRLLTALDDSFSRV